MTENDIALIDVLPDEILLAVFRCLALQDVKLNLALVCKRWYEVSKSSCLLQDLTFGPSISTETAIKVLRQAPLLSRLKLLSRTDPNDLLNELSSSNTKIEKLKISANKDARYTEVESEAILQCVRSLVDLKYLILKRVTFDNPEDVFKNLGSISGRLVALNLNHNIQLDTESLYNLVMGLPALKELRIYSISFNRIGWEERVRVPQRSSGRSVTPYTDAPVEDILRKMVDTLQVLKLNMLGITGAVFQSLSSLPQLRILHLYRMVLVQDESFVLLRRLKKLEKLVVTIPRTITSQCWSQLLGSHSMAQLTKITISNSYSVDDSVLRTIAANCPYVEDLGFPGCRGITKGGVSSLIIKCRNLTRLNLFSTKAIIAESFRLVPLFLPNLEILIFRAVDRTDTTFPENVRAMPNILLSTVYRYP